MKQKCNADIINYADRMTTYMHRTKGDRNEDKIIYISEY